MSDVTMLNYLKGISGDKSLTVHGSRTTSGPGHRKKCILRKRSVGFPHLHSAQALSLQRFEQCDELAFQRTSSRMRAGARQLSNRPYLSLQQIDRIPVATA